MEDRKLTLKEKEIIKTWVFEMTPKFQLLQGCDTVEDFKSVSETIDKALDSNFSNNFEKLTKELLQ